MSIHTFYPPAAGDACGGSFAASGDGPAGGGGRRRACRSSWDAAMGPRLGNPLQTNFLALGKKCNPGGAAGARDAAKKLVQNYLILLPILRLEPTSPSWLRDSFTAALSALHINVQT